jgi:hypothetical protein
MLFGMDRDAPKHHQFEIPNDNYLQQCDSIKQHNRLNVTIIDTNNNNSKVFCK